MSYCLSAGIKGRRDEAFGQEVRWLLQKNVVMQTFVQKQVAQETAPERDHDSDQTTGKNVCGANNHQGSFVCTYSHVCVLQIHFS